ncbi:hypothetical protein [Streptomyces sp. BPTC-684]|uniref:hypothetical protein n=1 Tax=Streptomyces sp. BPTC-684 TaxID=3043734 RepID=UPI0024B2763B|nr:hypothetical protein [Streptomyces sp. BPTC-684]WHM41078.1 hypothetical protein QIY60_32275 [Streptomyces sp. BPTC-684]
MESKRLNECPLHGAGVRPDYLVGRRLERVAASSWHQYATEAPSGPLDVWLIDSAEDSTHQLDLIQAEAARCGVEIHIVLDVVHVVEKLWAAARCFHPATDPDTETWVGFKTVRILAGDTFGAVADIHAEADRNRLSDQQRTAVEAACRYLTNNADFVRYDHALKAGWPIASGIVEGAARHLVADRLDITGSRWSVPGAEAVLILRALISNGDFDAYWHFHIQKERQRLYPRPDRHDNDLLARKPNPLHESRTYFRVSSWGRCAGRRGGGRMGSCPSGTPVDL